MLRIYVDKKERKKIKKTTRKKRFPGSGEVFVVFHKMPERQEAPRRPSRHTARGGPAAAVWRLANQTETDKAEMEIDILLVSKKPKVSFTNKTCDGSRKTRFRRIKQKTIKVFDKRAEMRSSRRGCLGDCAPLVCWGDAHEPTTS